MHLCKYCYANRNEKIVKENWDRHSSSPHSETIFGNAESKEGNSGLVQTRLI
jgi:hypothetical protein